MYHAGNNEDPYITVPDEQDKDEDEEEDITLQASDCVIICGRTEEVSVTLPRTARGLSNASAALGGE